MYHYFTYHGDSSSRPVEDSEGGPLQVTGRVKRNPLRRDSTGTVWFDTDK